MNTAAPFNRSGQRRRGLIVRFSPYKLAEQSDAAGCDLLNFRRRDCHAVAASKTDKLDKLNHSRRCRMRCAAVRAYHLCAGCWRTEQASCGAFPDFRRHRRRIG